MGSGTSLDTLRLTQRIAQECRVHPRSVHAWVVGEHGDSSVFLLGSATVGTLPLLEFAAQRGVDLTPERLEAIEVDVRRAAYEVRDLKGAAVQGIGLTVSGLVHAIAHEVGAIIPVSVRVADDVCASLPCVLGPGRAERAVDARHDPARARVLGAFARGVPRGERSTADLLVVARATSLGQSSSRAAMARPISSDAVAAGDGALRTCSARPTCWNAKSSTSVPSAETAWARTPAGARSRSPADDLGHEPLQRPGEPALAERPGHLGRAVPPVLRGELAEPAECERVAHVRDLEPAPRVALAGEREAPRSGRRARGRRRHG